LTAFGLGFTPHVQGQPCTELHLRAHAVDVLLHLAIAPIAPLYGIGRRGEQRSIEKRQRFFPRRGKALLQCVTEGGEPLDASPPLGQFVEGRLGPPAPLEQGLPLFHDRPQRVELGQPTSATP